MKRMLFILVILLAIIANGQAQDKLKIGEIRNGKFQVTNPDALKSHFMKSLGQSGTLGKEYQLSTAPEGDRIFICFPVSGNKDNVTNIGLMLVKINSDVFIIANPPETPITGAGGGGSVEVSCTGVDCNQCIINIQWVGGNWIPEVYCDCRSGGGGKCNMTIKVTFKIDI